MHRSLPALMLLAACGTQAPAPTPAPADDGWTPRQLKQLADLRLQEGAFGDPTNRFAGDARAIELGRTWFYDEALSPGGFSCASCHKPELHFTDALPLAVAAGTAGRHTPTIEGIQQGPWFFWDGRADSLWAQAMGPVESDVEMDSDRTFVAHVIREQYAAAYEEVFGPLPQAVREGDLPARARPDAGRPEGELHQAWLGMTETQRKAVTEVFVNVSKAIGAFELLAVPQPAPFDAFVDAVLTGDPSGGGHLSDEAVDGLRLFIGDANCVSCHLGPFFTDRAFHNLGLPEPGSSDFGRTTGASRLLASEFNCQGPWSDATSCEELRFLNPDFDDFKAAFKTPPLRNVTKTAPYMHFGGLQALDDVLEFYSELPSEPWTGHRELTLQPLHLDEAQRSSLVAFLTSLESGVRPEVLPVQAVAEAPAEP